MFSHLKALDSVFELVPFKMSLSLNSLLKVYAILPSPESDLFLYFFSLLNRFVQRDKQAPG